MTYKNSLISFKDAGRRLPIPDEKFRDMVDRIKETFQKEPDMNRTGIITHPSRMGRSMALAAMSAVLHNTALSGAVSSQRKEDDVFVINKADCTPSPTIGISEAMRKLDAALPGVTIFEDIDTIRPQDRQALLGLTSPIVAGRLVDYFPAAPVSAPWSAVFTPAKKRKPKQPQRASRKDRKARENDLVADGRLRSEARRVASGQLHIKRSRQERIEAAQDKAFASILHFHVLTPEEESKWATAFQAAQDHMKKEGITPAF